MIDFILYFIVLQIVLLIPSFFFYRKLIARLSARYINLKSILITLTAPVIFTLVFGFFCTEILNPVWRSKEFESKEWIESIDGRYRMVNDLKSRNLLIGKSKSEVIEILGKDYKENCWLENTYCYLAYDPDNFGFFVLDHYEFIVYFDTNNLVKKVSYELI